MGLQEKQQTAYSNIKRLPNDGLPFRSLTCSSEATTIKRHTIKRPEGRLFRTGADALVSAPLLTRRWRASPSCLRCRATPAYGLVAWA